MAQPAGVEGELEVARHNSDNRVGTAIKVDLLTQDLGVSLETLLPERVADDGDRRGVLVLQLGKAAAQQGFDSERREQRGRHPLSLCVKWRSGSGQVVASADITALAGEGPAFALESQNVGSSYLEVVRIFVDQFVQTDK